MLIIEANVYTLCTNDDNEQNHVINWNEAKVMACQPNYHQRLEAWHICVEAQTMNRDAGPLPPVYDPLIHKSHP